MLQNKNPTPQRWVLRLAIHRAFRALAPSVSLLGLKQTAMGTARPHLNATMLLNLRLTLHSSAIHSKQIPRVRYALPRLPCVKTTAPGTAPHRARNRSANRTQYVEPTDSNSSLNS